MEGEGSVPSSVFCGDLTPAIGVMVHTVVRRLANGVDRVKLSRLEVRPDFFPNGTRELDLADGRVMDAVQLGRRKLGLEWPDDSTSLVGCMYEDGDLLHIASWVCVDKSASSLLSRFAVSASEMTQSMFSDVRVLCTGALMVGVLLPSPICWAPVYSETTAHRQQHVQPSVDAPIHRAIELPPYPRRWV